MRISHILYKVKDRDEAVKDFEAMGFTVIPGGFNSNIWFEDGSFIELFSIKKNKFLIFLFKLIGKKSFAHKFEYYQNADYGFVEYSLEHDKKDLDVENAKLKKMGYKYDSFSMKKKRQGVKLKWKITFPFDLKIPFLVAGVQDYKTYAMPKKIHHKNGATSLEKLVWAIPEKYINDIKKICADDRLELVQGDGFKEIKINGFDSDIFNRKYYK